MISPETFLNNTYNDDRVVGRFRVLSTLLFISNVIILGIFIFLFMSGFHLSRYVIGALTLNLIVFPWLNFIIVESRYRREIVYLWLLLYLVELSFLVVLFNGAISHLESIFALFIVMAGFIMLPRDILVITSVTVAAYGFTVMLVNRGGFQGGDIFGMGALYLPVFPLLIIVGINILILVGVGFLMFWTILYSNKREAELLRNQEQLQDAQRIARLVSWELNLSTGIISWSDAICDLLQINRYEDISNFSYFVETFVPAEDQYLLTQLIDNKGIVEKTKNYEFRLFQSGGEIKSIRTELRPVVNSDGKVDVYRGTMLDVTDQRYLEKELVHLAHYDELTDLVNRSLFYRLLAQEIANARREARNFCLLFLDLDGFKEINDNYGHDAGDKTLAEAARRMKDLVRDNDVIARMGGDEFSIILQNINDIVDAEIVSDKIIKSINEPIIIGNGTTSVNVGVSIGIALYPDHTGDEAELVKFADDAMYRSKSRGKNCHTVHSLTR